MSLLAGGIRETAQALGMDPIDLATIISYETGGTFNPTQAGPTTQWGQHRGFIQFGEPQAREYGVDWSDPVNSQLGPDGAVARYFRGNGWQPGMGLLDAYSIVNAGAPGRYNASDANNGGAPGTVRDKVTQQMDGHRRNAARVLGIDSPQAVASDTMLALGRQPQPQMRETMSAKDQPMMQEPNVGPLGGLLGIKRDTSKINDLGMALMALSSPQAAGPIMQMVSDRRKGRDERTARAEAEANRNRTVEWLRQTGGPNAAAAAEALALGAIDPQTAFKVAMEKPEAGYSVMTGSQIAAQYGVDPTAGGIEPGGLYNVSPAGQVTKVGGSGTNVTVQTGPNSDKFSEEADKAAAARLSGYVEQGATAAQFMGDLQALGQIGQQIETGAGAQVMAALGPYAQAFGIEIEGLGPMQAYKAITDRLAPQMRAPGSGATSDFEGRQFLNALPNLGRTPEGNQIVMQTLEALQRHKMAAAELSARALNGEITWQDAERQIRELGNPYEAFNEFRKRAEPAEKPQEWPGAPPVGAVDGGYRYRGGDPARPESWEKVQ